MEELTSKTFDEVIKNSKIPVLVDFWASWCGPCKKISPMLTTFAEENKDVKVVKVNIEENPEISARHNVQSIPFFVLYNHGKIIASKPGAISKGDIRSFIDNHIDS